MKLKDAVVFVTGANRGIGLAFAREALARGARKVYAAARDPAMVTLEGVVPVTLDVVDPTAIEAAARACGDVTLLINNAGIARTGSLLADDSIDEMKRHLEVNFYGPLRLTRAFAPILAANGGGAVVNVLSVASWVNRPMLGVYGISKTAAWGLTNALRNDLHGQGTQVLGLHVGFVDTDLTHGFDVPKLAPQVVVQRTFDGLEAGASEVLADERSAQVRQGLAAEPGIYLETAG